MDQSIMSEKLLLTYLTGRPDVQKPLDASIKDLREKLRTLEENEKIAVRAALTEERARYCLLIECIKPFVVSALLSGNALQTWLCFFSATVATISV